MRHALDLAGVTAVIGGFWILQLSVLRWPLNVRGWLAWGFLVVMGVWGTAFILGALW